MDRKPGLARWRMELNKRRKKASDAVCHFLNLSLHISSIKFAV